MLLVWDGVKNEIFLLENCFCIDYKIDKVILLFFCNCGVFVVVLVCFDGIKYYVIDLVKNYDFDWYDEFSYDLVIIINFMLGLWQVVGKILLGSCIMVMGEIELDVDFLLLMLFCGEIVKLIGCVLNDGEFIEVGQFCDVISLNVDFVSINNSDYLNFGVGM